MRWCSGTVCLRVQYTYIHTVTPHTHLLVEFNHPSNEASTECRVEGVGNDEQIFGGEGLHVHLRGRGWGQGWGRRGIVNCNTKRHVNYSI